MPNLSRPIVRRWVHFALAGMVLLGAAPAQPQSTEGPHTLALPQLGDGADMVSADERRLGDRIARVLYRDPDYLDDPVILDYVHAIWQPLLAAARQRGDLAEELDQAFAWEVLLGRDRSVNAFALPGGYLGLHIGLLAVVANQDELASVLAHELSHVTQRHISRSMSRQKDLAPWLMGAMVLGMLAASKDPGSASAMVAGGQAAAAQTQLNFSRDMEREADRIGFGVMSQAGYATQGFVTMFQKLQQASRLNDAGGFPYLRSHPLTTERMADMQARVPSQAAIAPSADQEAEHAMVSARARVLANTGADALRSWEQEAAPENLRALTAARQAGIQYGAALAAAKLRNFAASQVLIDSLITKSQGQVKATRLVRQLAAELALLQGNSAGAQMHLQTLRTSVYPSQSQEAAKVERATLLLQAQTDTLQGHANAASEALRTWLSQHPGDAQAWLHLAGANHALGRVVAAVRCEAEANAAQLDFAAAYTRLKVAQELSRNAGASEHIEASIVDTRLRQIELALREQGIER